MRSCVAYLKNTKKNSCLFLISVTIYSNKIVLIASKQLGSFLLRRVTRTLLLFNYITEAADKENISSSRPFVPVNQIVLMYRMNSTAA